MVSSKHKSAFKNYYDKLCKIDGEPKDIAFGFALGLFIGMTPTMGVQMPIAVFFALLFKTNKISAAIGVWITNPLTAPFIYTINYIIGSKLLFITSIKDITIFSKGFENIKIFELIQNAPNIFAALTLGGIVIGIPLAVMGYYLSYSVIDKHRKTF